MGKSVEGLITLLPPQKPTHGNFAPLPQNSSLQKSNLATTILFSSSFCDSSNRPPKTSLQSKIFKGCPIWPPPSSSPPASVIPAIGHLRPVCRAKYSKVVPSGHHHPLLLQLL